MSMGVKFSIARKGYSPEEVDDYIESVQGYVAKLEAKYKAVMQELKALNDSVGEYRQKESSINNAIVSSQVSADSILNNARNAADNIVRSAKTDAAQAREALERHLSDIIVGLQPQRKLMSGFRREYEKMLDTYAKDAGQHNFDSVEERFDILENYIREFTGQ